MRLVWIQVGKLKGKNPKDTELKMRKVNFHAPFLPKANPRPTDIVYIYEILYCNHFIILSNTTA